MFVDLINGSAEAQISGSGWVHVGYDGCSSYNNWGPGGADSGGATRDWNAVT